MKYYILAATFMFIIAGCVTTTPESETLANVGTQGDVPFCRTVITEEPYTEEVCQQISYTEEECEMKELTYTSGQIAMTDLCVEDGECVGKDITACPLTCERAMKRCRMNITNEDAYEGTWIVGATFGYNGAAFVKNPESEAIEPGETYTFDFQQIYSMGSPPSTATCSVTVLYPAIAKICVNIEKTRTDCSNITRMRAVETEVCN